MQTLLGIVEIVDYSKTAPYENRDRVIANIINTGGTGLDSFYKDFGLTGIKWFIHYNYPAYSEPCTCCKEFSLPDNLALHLIGRHGWDAEKARLWLRDRVEVASFGEGE